MKLRSLLAATDLSAHAERAVRRAALIAQEHALPLELLHVRDVESRQRQRAELGELHVTPAVAHAWEEAGRRELEALAAEIGRSSGVQIRGTLRTGNPVAEIAAAAKGRDLLVLGAQGEHPLRDLFIGTSADRLLQKCPVAMLVVKTAPLRPYGTVLVAVDDESDDPAALRMARTLAPSARCELLHVAELPLDGKMLVAGVAEADIEHYRQGARARALERLRGMIAAVPDAAGSCIAHVRPGDPRREILEEAAQRDADLIVLFKRSSGWLRQLFLGSVTRHVLFDARCDVLVLPPAARATTRP